jgi:hypothetical protein
MDPHARIPGRDECVVGNLLQRWAHERPARNFLEFEHGGAWTFSEALDRVQRCSRLPTTHSSRPGILA